MAEKYYTKVEKLSIILLPQYKSILLFLLDYGNSLFFFVVSRGYSLLWCMGFIAVASLVAEYGI